MNAAKLTDKQTNILFISVACVVFLLLAVLIYFDYDELVQTQQNITQKRIELAKRQLKEQEIKELTEQLWYLREKYRRLQALLPSKQESVNFYTKLDSFRLEQGIQPWKFFKSKDANRADDLTDKDPRSMKSKATPTAPKPAGPYTQTLYQASLAVTFDQLLKLLHKIETDERFYGLQEIRISAPGDLKATGGNPELSVDLTLVSFTYASDLPMDQQVEVYFQDPKDPKKTRFEPPPYLKDKIENDTKAITKDISSLPTPSRNPFDKERVLQLVGPKEVTPDSPILPPPPQDLLKKEMEKLQQIRNELHKLYIAENWIELSSGLAKYEYERELSNLQTTKNNDPDGTIAQKLNDMRKELKDWQSSLHEATIQDKARLLVSSSHKRIKEMEELQQQGQQKGMEEFYNKIIKIHNELMPQYRDYQNLEDKIPDLAEQRKQLERFYSEAETQIKIIQLASKLKLEGIVYMPKKPELSIAFINKQLVRKGDIVTTGFVVHEIEEQGVILRYKEKTVPIRFRRLDEKMLNKEPKIKEN